MSSVGESRNPSDGVCRQLHWSRTRAAATPLESGSQLHWSRALEQLQTQGLELPSAHRQRHARQPRLQPSSLGSTASSARPNADKLVIRESRHRESASDDSAKSFPSHIVKSCQFQGTDALSGGASAKAFTYSSSACRAPKETASMPTSLLASAVGSSWRRCIGRWW